MGWTAASKIHNYSVLHNNILSDGLQKVKYIITVYCVTTHYLMGWIAVSKIVYCITTHYLMGWTAASKIHNYSVLHNNILSDGLQKVKYITSITSAFMIWDLKFACTSS
jgi:hypothetical protein